VVALLWLQRQNGVGLSERMLLPLVPFALVLAAGVTRSWRERTNGVVRSLSVIILAVALGCGQCNLYTRAGSARGRVIVPTMVAALAESPAVRAHLQEEGEHPVLANEPQLAGEVLGQPVLGLPSSDNTAVVWDETTVRDLVQRYGV